MPTSGLSGPITVHFQEIGPGSLEIVASNGQKQLLSYKIENESLQFITPSRLVAGEMFTRE